jgi:hypothetical protein
MPRRVEPLGSDVERRCERARISSAHLATDDAQMSTPNRARGSPSTELATAPPRRIQPQSDVARQSMPLPELRAQHGLSLSQSSRAHRSHWLAVQRRHSLEPQQTPLSAGGGLSGQRYDDALPELPVPASSSRYCTSGTDEHASASGSRLPAAMANAARIAFSECSSIQNVSASRKPPSVGVTTRVVVAFCGAGG